jgi:vacuolar-type H+-ATPase subunit I/STV1
MSESDDLDDLLAELEDDTLELDQLPEKTPRIQKEAERINEDNVVDTFYSTLSDVADKLKRATNELIDKVEAGDTYESTLQGLAALIGHANNTAGKLDAREARKEKMAHDKAMADIKLEHKLIELEKRGDTKKIVTNTQNNNHFYGGITDCLKGLDKIEKSEDEPKVFDID